MVHTCKIHGQCKHRLMSRGKNVRRLRCTQCMIAAQKKTRRKRKQTLVMMMGGQCINCKYSRCFCSLDFHHIDKATKKFAISRTNSINVQACIKEVKKCIILCKNCHAEYETGYQPTVEFVDNYVLELLTAQAAFLPPQFRSVTTTS
jgi:hypothetical protein